MELDLETGLKVLDLLEVAKDEIVDHVMDAAPPTARMEVFAASIAAVDEAVAKMAPENHLMCANLRDAEVMQAELVQAAGWGPIYAELTQVINNLKLLLGAPPETEEALRAQSICH